MYKNIGNRAIKISIWTSFFNFWGFHMYNNIGCVIHKVLFCILVYFGHIWQRFQLWDFADNQVPQTKKYLINSAFDGVKYDGNKIITNLSEIEAFFYLYKLEMKITIAIV